MCLDSVIAFGMKCSVLKVCSLIQSAESAVVRGTRETSCHGEAEKRDCFSEAKV